MTETGSTDLSDRDALAAEYVLGTLSLDERSKAVELMRGDAAFAALVGDWQNRLSPLNDGYVPADPPRQALQAAEARLFPSAPPQKSRLGMAMLAAFAIVAAALAIIAVIPIWVKPPNTAATLTATGQDLTVMAAYDSAGGTLTAVRSAGTAAGTGQDYQLWAVPEGEGPVALGLLREGPLVLELPALPPGTVLGVSLEPEGGSPTGQPSAPMLVSATLAKE